MSINQLARQALGAAVRTRVRAGVDAYCTVCIFDIAEAVGIDLRFQAVKSLEAVYSPGVPPVVVVSALRPSGRQRMNCAHEIGHHVFDHGARIDQLADEGEDGPAFDPDEFICDCFAEYLLMPKIAVLSSLSTRGLRAESMQAVDAYRLACNFGVSYRALLHHLQRNIGILPHQRAEALRKVPPGRILPEVEPELRGGELLIADALWRGRPIDLHVGDLLLVPRGSVAEGAVLAEVGQPGSGSLLRAAKPGIGRVANDTSAWASFVRVARRVQGGGFVGRSIYRHEPDDDE